jgi:hypothetical protein
MSLHSVERLLHEMNRDAAMAERFHSNPDPVVGDRGLDDEEIAMLKNRDVLALYRHGVHPLLLAPASRFFGMEQAAFRSALQPAMGERKR